MKIKVVSIFVLLLFISTPLLVYAQQMNDTAQAVMDAKNDVKEPFGWFAGSFLTSVAFGCLGGSVIIATSQVIPAEAPTYQLLGKSPAYVSSYANAYKKEAKQKRLIHTSAGCVGGSAVAAWLVLYVYPSYY